MAGFRLEFTTTAHNNLLLERFFRLSMVVLLNIEVKCSHLRAKLAKVSGHLPSVKGHEMESGIAVN